MGIGRRLYDLVRANVGYRIRRGLDELRTGPSAAAPEPEVGHGPEPGVDTDPDLGAGYGSRRSGRSAGASSASGAADPRLERHYRSLELPYGADAEAVRRAHRRLLRRYHPDRFARDTERLQDATRLSQELTRARDELLAALARGEIRGRPPG